MITKTITCLGVQVRSFRRLILGLLNRIAVQTSVVCVIFFFLGRRTNLVGIDIDLSNNNLKQSSMVKDLYIFIMNSYII